MKKFQGNKAPLTFPDSTVAITEVKEENPHWASFKTLLGEVQDSKKAVTRQFNIAEDLAAKFDHKSSKDKSLEHKANEFNEKVGDASTFLQDARKVLNDLEALDQSEDLSLDSENRKKAVALKAKADAWCTGLKATIKVNAPLVA